MPHAKAIPQSKHAPAESFASQSGKTGQVPESDATSTRHMPPPSRDDQVKDKAATAEKPTTAEEKKTAAPVAEEKNATAVVEKVVPSGPTQVSPREDVRVPIDLDGGKVVEVDGSGEPSHTPAAMEIAKEIPDAPAATIPTGQATTSVGQEITPQHQ